MPSGIAGDMLMAALLDAGGQLDQLLTDLKRLGIGNIAIETKRVSPSGIAAPADFGRCPTRSQLATRSRSRAQPEHSSRPPHSHTTATITSHSHDHEHSHDHHHTITATITHTVTITPQPRPRHTPRPRTHHDHDHGHHHHRPYPEVRRIISDSQLSDPGQRTRTGCICSFSARRRSCPWRRPRTGALS